MTNWMPDEAEKNVYMQIELTNIKERMQFIRWNNQWYWKISMFNDKRWAKTEYRRHGVLWNKKNFQPVPDELLAEVMADLLTS